MECCDWSLMEQQQPADGRMGRNAAEQAAELETERVRKVYQIHEYNNRRVEKIREGYIPDH